MASAFMVCGTPPFALTVTAPSPTEVTSETWTTLGCVVALKAVPCITSTSSANTALTMLRGWGTHMSTWSFLSMIVICTLPALLTPASSFATFRPAGPQPMITTCLAAIGGQGGARV